MDVEGAVQIDGEYNYETAKTRYLLIPPASWSSHRGGYSGPESFIHMDDNGATVWLEGGVIGMANVSAPINLPVGATITRVDLIYFDNKSQDVTFTLKKKPYNGTTTTNIATNTKVYQGNTLQTLTLTPSELISSTNMYWLTVNMHTGNDLHRIFGCRLTYTTTRAE